MIRIEDAQKEQAAAIAHLIMEAMNYDCCQWFAGPDHTLEEFHQLITTLVERDDSQYSYLNTLVAITESNNIAGICVSYDGATLRRLRQPFVDGALAVFGRDYSDMDDETTAGELYVDSLCVDKDFRGQGIATQLLEATIAKGRKMNLPTGLLVDTGNPQAERLYHHVGFVYVDDNEWGGHKMKHLQRKFG
ncbi:GNAT family N-acetyltransferase [Prevotella fusca]|uniref:GNAT family N-acetyltransferase n=1 Tax=Prevotella fusca JCM 17724 TaxID=1236517 RepID=A0A0K1NIQ4_9BACT|nr:GNAT family N-acetyltransferase [Prevotella fusca]AKU68915.1 zinc ABC transporter permease [Prevotella fusca JCM 17724]QUB86536.1 GNAT family N-acetyltransferase [Prevotella fusca JCM 17724]